MHGVTRAGIMYTTTQSVHMLDHDVLTRASNGCITYKHNNNNNNIIIIMCCLYIYITCNNNKSMYVKMCVNVSTCMYISRFIIIISLLY